MDKVAEYALNHIKECKRARCGICREARQVLKWAIAVTTGKKVERPIKGIEYRSR